MRGVRACVRVCMCVYFLVVGVRDNQLVMQLLRPTLASLTLKFPCVSITQINNSIVSQFSSLVDRWS